VCSLLRINQYGLDPLAFGTVGMIRKPPLDVPLNCSARGRSVAPLDRCLIYHTVFSFNAFFAAREFFQSVLLTAALRLDVW
jgi:hypothetical protein